MPRCHRHMVIATDLSSLFDLLLCCTHLKRGPNVALSSPQLAVIECFLARFGKAYTPHWTG